MARYIDADRFMLELNKAQLELDESYEGLKKAKVILSSYPTADVAPVRHGYWINTPPFKAPNGNYNKEQECSECRSVYLSSGNTPYSNHSYCPHCGAKMDGGNK